MLGGFYHSNLCKVKYISVNYKYFQRIRLYHNKHFLGITHATVWAALSSYMAHNTAPHLKGPSQGILQCVHLGIGRGCGAIFGGLLCDVNGTGPTFRLYGKPWQILNLRVNFNLKLHVFHRILECICRGWFYIHELL